MLDIGGIYARIRIDMKKEKRVEVWEKYGKRCAYCGKELEFIDMQVDHLTPKNMSHLYTNKRSRGYYNLQGDNVDSFENLMPSCRRCNHYKRSYSLEDFRRLMKTLHKRISGQYIDKVAIDYGIIKLTPFSGKFYFERENP